MEKLKKIKYNFDRITSENSKNWKLVLLWIVIFELFASILEYFDDEKSLSFISSFPSGFYLEMSIALLFTLFLWLCVINIIFFKRSNFLTLILYTCFGIYWIITKDLTFNFLLHNLEPLHFLNANFTFLLFIELFIKFVILYLLYQLIISYSYKKIEE